MLKRTRGTLLEAFGGDKTGHLLTENSDWADHSQNMTPEQAVWRMTQAYAVCGRHFFGHKAAAWDTSQREATFITKARAHEDGALLI